MTAGPVPERAGWPRQRGMTLVELLIAMALALLVVLFATAGFVGSKQLFTADAEAQAVEDTLRFAGFVVKGIVRQAGYADYTPDHTGADGEVALPGAGAPSDDGSDSLLVRFFGRSRAGGDATEPDGTMVDCMGFPQAGPMPGTQASADRAWSFFYIAKAADGEPELYCKYRSEKDGSFRAEPLARGIEVFNVVFGHDGDGDGVPERWLDAAQLEAGAPSGDKVAAEWRKVVGLRIGMVARSDRPGAWPRLSDEALYPLGSTFPGAGFKPPADGRLRRVATFTVMLRNAVAGPVP
jgi:type IV pilus assembly protein PilW